MNKEELTQTALYIGLSQSEIDSLSASQLKSAILQKTEKQPPNNLMNGPLGPVATLIALTQGAIGSVMPK